MFSQESYNGFQYFKNILQNANFCLFFNIMVSISATVIYKQIFATHQHLNFILLLWQDIHYINIYININILNGHYLRDTMNILIKFLRQNGILKYYKLKTCNVRYCFTFNRYFSVSFRKDTWSKFFFIWGISAPWTYELRKFKKKLGEPHL